METISSMTPPIPPTPFVVDGAIVPPVACGSTSGSSPSPNRAPSRSSANLATRCPDRDVRALTAQQQRWLVPVVAEFEARNRFQRERQRRAVIVPADAVLADAERQRRGPTPEIAIDRVVLFLQRPVARFEAMLQA